MWVQNCIMGFCRTLDTWFWEITSFFSTCQTFSLVSTHLGYFPSSVEFYHQVSVGGFPPLFPRISNEGLFNISKPFTRGLPVVVCNCLSKVVDNLLSCFLSV